MKISINHTTNYDITVGSGIIMPKLHAFTENKHYFVCIDKAVLRLHGQLLEPILAKASDVLVIESTEQLKSQVTVDSIHLMLNQGNASRKSLLLAIGGGIVGDVCGYAAAIYMRGLPFIQVPTTLLSQVDSSIGSKVAINAFGAKNNIGTFYSPTAVVIDLAFLTTLSTRLFKEGLAELIKHGFIVDLEILALLDGCSSITDLMANTSLLKTLICHSLAVKQALVEADFYDTGQRHLLNFGHTFAHALELSSPTHLYHGECVAIGMLVSSLMSGNLATYTRVRELLEKFDCLREFQPVDLSKIISDKKRADADIFEVFLPEIGKPEIRATNMATLQQLFATTYSTIRADKSIKTCKSQFVFSPVKLQGTITIPPSKSYAHRYLIAAALANTPTILSGFSERSDDIIVTQTAIEALGAKTIFDAAAGTISVFPHHVPVSSSRPSVDLKESGTSLRLLLPVLIAKLGSVRLTGENQLPKRPLDTFFTCFSDVRFTKEVEQLNLPLVCDGVIKPGHYSLEGNISSQFLSGLLLTLPLLEASSTISMSSALQSVPYVVMTLEVLHDFGITVSHSADYSTFEIPGLQQYKSAGAYIVESDYSGRGFFEVANAFAEHDITILPPAHATTQGDRLVLDVIHDKNYRVDLIDVPDTAPILAVLFSQFGGIMHNTDRLKYKESDRLAAIARFLSKMGIPFVIEGDDLIISPGTVLGGHFDTYKDHRITMSLIIASTIASTPFILDEITSVGKSYKNFIEHYQILGGFVDEK
ncbi:MAG: iron-containing alcohol dehydrogenase [Culicoidibacterales bacterium]